MHRGSMHGNRTIQRRPATRGSAILTPAMMHAAALDAAKSNMRRGGRSALNDEDVEIAIETFEKLFLAIGGPDGYLALPRDPA